MIPRNIFLLWLQGWDNAPWLQRQVLASWKQHNPTWNVIEVDETNLSEYVSDIPYIYDTSKMISPQAKSDIIRLALLNKIGGVWADATMLCMKPLDDWLPEATKDTNFWMYHGHGANMPKEIGPASWFIVSSNNNTIIQLWKRECDTYWEKNRSAMNYFWMDHLFKYLYHTNKEFQTLWDKVPYVYCEEMGSSHTLAHYKMERDTPELKESFREHPPHALKFWNSWNHIFPDHTSRVCQESNGYYAIQLSLRENSI